MISYKDAAKLVGLSILSCCAVFVCTLFLNFIIDLAAIEALISSPPVQALYDAQMSMGKAICYISGGCLLLTSAVMLFFYIKHYIDVHRSELGIQKALGYSNWSIARHFGIFGFSVFLGAVIGFFSSFLIMPAFYKAMNEDNILPKITMHFNPVLTLYLIVLPTLVFSLLAVLYGYFKLKHPVMELLKGKSVLVYKKKRRQKNSDADRPFLTELRKSTVKSRPSLIFFVGFSAFCFSEMMQMTLSMGELASELFAAIIFVIGVILSCVTLLLSLTTVVRSNTKTISMMRVFGYSFQECSGAILNGYRPVALVGFAVGTLYQYVLIKLILTLFSETSEAIPEYNFDWGSFFLVFIAFTITYEATLMFYRTRIKKLSLKEVMLD